MLGLLHMRSKSISITFITRQEFEGSFEHVFVNLSFKWFIINSIRSRAMVNNIVIVEDHIYETAQ